MLAETYIESQTINYNCLSQYHYNISFTIVNRFFFIIIFIFLDSTLGLLKLYYDDENTI